MMMSGRNDDDNVAKNKELVQSLCAQDGVLVSPIDLSLSSAKSLRLEPLRWANFDVAPFRMKLTNSGDTLVISAKWAKERPYLSGGPLDGNYVFSQVHFHWGSSENEGSEHTAKGTCFPMEMHVVFFKTRYLTQAAALKQDDGIIILAYLFRLQPRSAPGLHWLAGQLSGIVEPRTSAQVPPMPLSTLLVPFDADYVTYWGALVSQNCRHPVMWLVSRAALAISEDDLNLFRNLLNAKKEKMTKNFRATSPAGGRAVFHVNPSADKSSLLHPGAVDPPCQAVVVNYSQVPPIHQTEAKKIFEKGDSSELEAKDLRDRKKEQPPKNKNLSNEGPLKIGDVTNHQRKPRLMDSESEASAIRHPSPASNKSADKKPKTGTLLQRQCTITKSKPVKAKNTEKKPEDYVHVNSSSTFASPPGKSTPTSNVNASTKSRENSAKSQKSKVPIPKMSSTKRGRLESRYASYFKRPESAPTEQANEKHQTKPARPSTRVGGN